MRVLQGMKATLDPNDEVQLFSEVQSSAQQTQEFLATLNEEDMKYPLGNVLAMGRGSLDFA